MEHREDRAVQMAVRSLEGLMASQGKSKDAYHQRGMTPEAKARNTLARLHEAGKAAQTLLLIVLTIQAAHAELGPWGAPDWEAVQISKQAKRLRGAAGTHYPDAPSRYPRSEGLYLRHLGRMLAERASLGIGGDTIDHIRERARPSIKRPRPKPAPPRDDTVDELRRMQAFTAALRGGSWTVTARG
ncbi:hypothetical protein [Kaistia defluvii]